MDGACFVFTKVPCDDEDQGRKRVERLQIVSRQCIVSDRRHTIAVLMPKRTHGGNSQEVSKR